MSIIALRSNKKKTKRDKVMEEIKLIKEQLSNVAVRFEQTSDSDLVEAIIYEMESLKARYRYFVKSARAFDAEDEKYRNFIKITLKV